MSLEEVAQVMGIDASRVAQLEKKALEKLRRGRGLKELKWFWERTSRRGNNIGTLGWDEVEGE